MHARVHVCVCVCVYVCRFPHTNKQFWIPAACLKIQLSAHTIYWKVELDSTSKVFSSRTPPFTSNPNHKSWLLSVLLTNWQKFRGTHNPLLRFKEFARTAHRTQENPLLTRITDLLLKDVEGYKSTVGWRDTLGEVQNRRTSVHLEAGASTWKQSCSPSWKLSKKGCIKLSFWVFVEVSLHSHDWLNHWPMVIDLTPSPSSLSGNQGVRFKVPTF